MKSGSITTIISISVLFLSAGCQHTNNGYNTGLEDQFNRILSKYEQSGAWAEPKPLTTSAQLDVEFSLDNQLQELVVQPLALSSNSVEMSLDGVLVRAILHSSQIKAFSDLPLIRKTGIQEAEGVFDIRAFVEARYERTDRPTGSILDTGGPDRLEKDDFQVEAGVRKKFAPGTEVELSQKIGHVDSNSTYFTPNPQGQAELSLKITQPLLKGAGYAYNASIIQIAEIDSEIARNELLRQVESHLVEVQRTYWTLYLARAKYLTGKRLMLQSEDIFNKLQSRADHDASAVQIARLKSVLAERRAALIRTESAIRNMQDRLKALLNDPSLPIYTDLEIIPTEVPNPVRVSQNFRQTVISALKNRPEISQAFGQLEVAMVRHEMSKNEILPTLNLFLENKLTGLEQDEPMTAFGNEFSDGGPSYGGGVYLEYPLGNNQMEAREMRRFLEVRQQTNQTLTTLETILLEVSVNYREVLTSYQDMLAKNQALEAAMEDLDTLQSRSGFSTLNQRMEATAYLDFLLDSQSRLATAEDNFMQSLATHQTALFNLGRAQGILLDYHNFSITEEQDDENRPMLRVGRN